MQAILATALAAMFLITSCSSNDKQEQFERVKIGDRRAQVIQAMGPPAATLGGAIPSVSGEVLVWRDSSSDYHVALLGEHVAAKLIYPATVRSWFEK